ncbi:MAG: hypothetical protein FVQ82_13035 [Planctomycetes bacterium]|nr:hypothetical protein [Planctomycetota bacterium]
MTCCGKANKIAGKAVVIVKGRIAMAMGKKYEFAEGRRRICRKCEHNTWLTKFEYGGWLFKHGIEVLTNLDDLTKLPMLPKKTEGNKIYCRLCKCPIVEKTNDADERCPLDKWER